MICILYFNWIICLLSFTFCFSYSTGKTGQVRLTERELEAVRLSSMARILCDNSQVSMMVTVVVVVAFGDGDDRDNGGIW